MGLDITAWRRLRPTAEPDSEFDYGHDTHVAVHASSHFPGRTAGLADGWYTGERRAFGPFHSFKAGSYSGYGEWRNWLAEFAGYPALDSVEDRKHKHSAGAWAASGGPFWELINFYDNEGEIGPVVSAKLARDFADWDERVAADVQACFDGYYSVFVLWRAAFEWASDGGCVEFG